MDAYDPATVFSSIDHGGRYAYGNQPSIAQWNLARLAEALLPLYDDDTQRAIDVVMPTLQSFADRFHGPWRAGLRAKLGVPEGADDDLGERFLALLEEQQVDLTSAFRALSATVRGTGDGARSLFADPAPFDAWAARWRPAVVSDPAALDRVNPLYIPRNHLVEEALAAATAGDLGPFTRLVDVVTRPFDERPGLERYADPAPPDFGPGYRTFCGT
jgi:uncharacterized protein YdiU (UPF0061 family)